MKLNTATVSKWTGLPEQVIRLLGQDPERCPKWLICVKGKGSRYIYHFNEKALREEFGDYERI